MRGRHNRCNCRAGFARTFWNWYSRFTQFANFSFNAIRVKRQFDRDFSRQFVNRDFLIVIQAVQLANRGLPFDGIEHWIWYNSGLHNHLTCLSFRSVLSPILEYHYSNRHAVKTLIFENVVTLYPVRGYDYSEYYITKFGVLIWDSSLKMSHCKSIPHKGLRRFVSLWYWAVYLYQHSDVYVWHKTCCYLLYPPPVSYQTIWHEICLTHPSIQ